MTFEELKNFFSNDRYAISTTGCKIISAENGKARVEIDIDDRHYNGNNVIQGGVTFTLADFSAAVAANSEEIAFVSADGNISYLSAGTGKKLIAEAEVIKKGKTLSFCETVITDENGKKIAKASFTMCRVRN